MTAKKEPAPTPAPTVAPLLTLDLDDAADVIDPTPLNGTPLFAYDPEKVALRKQKGIDTKPAFWHAAKWIDGKSASLDKTYPAHTATVGFLASQLGPGTYVVQMKNTDGVLLARATHHILAPAGGVSDARQILAGTGTIADAGAPRSGNMLDRVMEVMLLRALDPPKPPEPREDPMRDAMAAIVKGMALQQQMMAQSLQMQLQVGQAQGGPARQDSDRMYGLLEKMVTSKPGSNGSQSALAELMPLLTLGINLGARMTNATPAKEGEPKNPWLEMVPDLADSVGVPIIIALSQALPPEKAKEALRAIEEHMKARQAEAAAETANKPIDVPGTEVP